AHDRVIHGRIAVRMIFADDIADHAGRFLVRLVPVVAQFAHGVEHTPVHRLETVAHIRQRPADDDAHGIVEIRLAHLFFEVDRKNLFCDVGHRYPELYFDCACSGQKTMRDRRLLPMCSRCKPVRAITPCSRSGYHIHTRHRLPRPRMAYNHHLCHSNPAVMPAIDTLIRPRWIAPVGGKQRLLTEHAIAVHDGRITTVLPHAAADEQFSAAETIELTDHIVLPGLVNCHTHAAKSLLRGIVNDQPLMPWLQQHIWPAEEAHVSPAFVADGTALAMAEMIRGGTTCFNDMYHFPDTTARSAMHAGLRAAIGLLVIDQPTAWAANADQYIDKAIAVHDGFARHPLLTTLFAPHAPYTVSDRLLSRVRVLADELDLRVHMHIHETATELQQAADGVRPLTRLHRLGLLGPGLLAAHMTQLTRDEIDLCAEH